MRLVLVGFASFVVLSALGAATASAAPTRAMKLTPAEEKWIKPLINIYNVMNLELHNVIGEEEAPNALIVNSGKNNTGLNNTLGEFIACTGAVKKAGKLPTARLAPFLTALTTSCQHLGLGGQDVAKAIGAIGKANSNLAKSYLVKATNEFKIGSTFLATAEKQLTKVGGNNVFTA